MIRPDAFLEKCLSYMCLLHILKKQWNFMVLSVPLQINHLNITQRRAGNIERCIQQANAQELELVNI